MTTSQRAIEIAVEAHKGQTQKNDLPYVLHPLSLIMSMNTDDERKAAVLHEVIEDTQWSMDALSNNGFKPEVLEAIDCLTHQDGECCSQGASLCKLLNLPHNCDSPCTRLVKRF
ncbi:hypothetical protein N9383_02000 [Granulosicoccus sp.]|nr:hypothetical protein [Granulosicoccus sp.]